MDILPIIFLIIIIAIVYQTYSDDIYNWNKAPHKIDSEESFNGALQSLYSNDGIQDTHLTINSDREYGGPLNGYDRYRYWRGIPWNLPTRNLNRLTYNPYRYNYRRNRYRKLNPYW
jgi:hypothetical protein